MPIAFTLNINQKQFEQAGKRAGEIILAKKNLVYRAANSEQLSMLAEFRERQVSLPNKKGRKAKAADSEAVSKAVAFANAKAGRVEEKFGETWTNRTGKAAGGVHGYAKETEDGIEFGLTHAEHYGAYLEFADNRRFAVIEPLVRSRAARFMEKLRRIYAD